MSNTSESARLDAPENHEGVREVFDRTARTYDALNHLFSLNIDSSWRKRLVRRSEAAAGSRVLDVCTGTGDVALRFARSVAGAKVVALDFSPEMLARTRMKVASARLQDRIEVVEGDAHALPFADASFDVVSNSFGLRTLERREKALAEMARVAKPGGRVLVMEFLPPPPTLFGALYSWHLNKLMPFLGRLLTAHRVSYTYLSDTVASFPSADEILQAMERAGLTAVSYDRLTGGIAYLFYGRRA